MNCGLVHKYGIIDQTKENRVFAPNENGNVQQMEHYGDPIRPDKINSIKTEFTGQSNKKRNKYNQYPNQRGIVEPRQWYEDYFKQMYRNLKFKQNVLDKAMVKVDKFLAVKKKRDEEAE